MLHHFESNLFLHRFAKKERVSFMVLLIDPVMVNEYIGRWISTTIDIKGDAIGLKQYKCDDVYATALLCQALIPRTMKFT